MSSADARLEGDELIATRCLRAPIGLVWRALTTPEHLAAFWGGDHATVPADSVAVDLRIGGTFELETRTIGSAQPSRRLSFRYEQIDAPNRLVFYETESGIVTTITLTPDRECTTTTIHQHRLPPELRTDQARLGLAGVLESLATLLAPTPTDPLETGETAP